jgi:hypothetical protein
MGALLGFELKCIILIFTFNYRQESNDGIFFSSPPGPDRLRGPASLLPNGYWGDFSTEVKRPGREADHSPHQVPRLRVLGAIPPFPQYLFMEWCLIQQWMRLHSVALS